MYPDFFEEKNISTSRKEIFFPAPLKKDDKIAIISPASAVKDEYVYRAMSRIMERGYQPVLMPHALDHVSGSFAATKSERVIDLIEAVEDPDIKAIICARGGYGCCQILDNLPKGILARHPKWIVGFSDISALLSLWLFLGVASVHGPMAKHLALMSPGDTCTEALFDILENGGRFDYSTRPHEFNREGKASGVLCGGNMAVLNDLGGTPYDIAETSLKRYNDVILFFEDISEPIYKVNRMLWRLYLTGCLNKVKGIIFGQFTEYKPDKNFASMEEMINDFFNRLFPENPFPIVMNFPVGHTDLNYPLVEGANVELEVTSDFVRLKTTEGKL